MVVVVVVPVSTAPAGVPLLAWLNDEKTDCCLSGGASGEKALLEVGWSCGGRSAEGRMSAAMTNEAAM